MTTENSTPVQFLRSGSNILTTWPHNLPNDREHTQPAYQVIDPERITSAVGIMRSFEQKRQAAAADVTLSDEGKRQRTADAASNALANLRGMADKVRSLEAEYQELAANAVQIPEASAADAMHDMEIARMARSDAKTPTALELTSQRTRLALVRVPVEISGIKPETLERLRGSFVSPETALELEQRTAAIRAAREGVQRAIKLVSGLSDFGIAQKRAMVGAGFDV